MADNIKGITVKVGADTSDFIKELKKVDKEINQTAKTANELEKSLELDFDEKRFIQAQKKAQQALTQTNEKAEAIRKQLKFLEDSGAVDTDGYRKLETELAKTEVTAIKLNQQLKNLDKIELSNTYKDFYESVKKGSEELTKSAKNATDLSNKIKNTSLYGKELKNIQQQAREQLSSTRKEAEQLKNKLKQANEEKIPIEDYEELTKQLEDAEKSAGELEKELEKSSKINIDRLSNQFSNLSDKLNSAAKSTRGLSIAAAGAAAGMVKLAKDAVNATDDIATFATNYGLSAEAIQKWDYVARQSDVESEQLYKSLQKLNVAMGDQLIGNTSNATKALDRLGLSAENFESADDMLYALISEMSKLESVTEQTAIASDIFGERYASVLISLFAQGEEAINGYINEFKQIGPLTDDVVMAGANMDNIMRIATQAFTNAKIELGVSLIPVLKVFADFIKDDVVPAIKDLADWFDSLGKDGQKTVLVILLLTAALSPMLSALSKVIEILPKAISLFKKLKNTSFKTAAGVAAIGLAIGVITDLIDNWKEMSTIEKILKSLAVAALVAAAAMTVFHASWSVGLAIGAITAGVVAGIAAIKAAGEEIGVETDFDDTASLSRAAQMLNIPQANGGNKNVYNEDYSQYDININMSATGDLSYDSKALADEVIKQIILKKQAAGN